MAADPSVEFILRLWTHEFIPPPQKKKKPKCLPGWYVFLSFVF